MIKNRPLVGVNMVSKIKEKEQQNVGQMNGAKKPPPPPPLRIPQRQSSDEDQENEKANIVVFRTVSTEWSRKMISSKIT